MTMVFLALAFPVAMLFGLLLMEWLEEPVRADEIWLGLEGFLDSAAPDEIEAFVSEGFAPALDRYWRRRGHATTP